MCFLNLVITKTIRWFICYLCWWFGCEERCMLAMRFVKLMATASLVRQLKLYSEHWSVL